MNHDSLIVDQFPRSNAYHPDNLLEINAVQADRGRYLGYNRMIGRRRPEVRLEEPISSVPSSYSQKPLLRARL